MRRWILVALAMPFAASAESQLAPFFAGLAAAPNAAARREFIREYQPSPVALDLHDELPTIVETLQKGRAEVAYVAAQYLGYLASPGGRDPSFREVLRGALPALMAHFDDPPPPDEWKLETNGYRWQASGWQGLVFEYLQATGLQLPTDALPAVLRATEGPNCSGAIKQLARLKPL